MRDAIIITFTLLLISCGTDVEEEGEINDLNTYRNEYLGLTLQIPDNWKVAKRETMDAQQKMGSKLVENEAKISRSESEMIDKNTQQFLMISKHEAGAMVEENPSFIGLIEKVGHTPGIKTGKEYLWHSQKFLKRMPMYGDISEIKKSEYADGKLFEYTAVVTRPDGIQIKQRYCATVINNNAVVLISSYTNERKELDEIMNSVEFE